jgi:hypothetical protein
MSARLEKGPRPCLYTTPNKLLGLNRKTTYCRVTITMPRSWPSSVLMLSI